MLNIFKDNNGKLNVTADADMFIIPNSACKIDEFLVFAQAETRLYAEKLLADNGKVFNEKEDYFVAIWMTSDDLQCDNLRCHPSHITYDGIDLKLIFPSSYLIRSLIDIKENETTKIIFKDIIASRSDASSDEDSKYVCDITLNITAKQRKYRYASFGSFEDVLKRVCGEK